MTTTQEETRDMLRSMKDLIGYPIEGVDGEIGKVKDLLFDDEKWAIRYLVADTGGWLRTHKILISPRQLIPPETGFYARRFPATLTREQVERSPRLEQNEPISRQFEREFAKYYGHDPYWIGGDVWGAATYTGARIPPSPEEQEKHRRKIDEIARTHLRSFDEVTGYRIAATDGEIGHVEDMILETGTWRIQYLVVDTRNWLPGRKVLLNIDWLSSFNWAASEAEVNLTKEQIEKSPKYDPKAPVNRDYEEMLYDFYGRPRYW